VPIQAFLVIPQGTGIPPIGEVKTTDPYFSTTFPASSAIIPVNDFVFSAENPTAIGTVAAGSGAGKEKFDSLVIHKPVDKSSAALFSASAMGEHFGVVQLYPPSRRPQGGSLPGVRVPDGVHHEYHLVGEFR
jgi:hypothetical protein